MERINESNYEAYFLDYLEGSLSAEDRMDLMAFLEKHPALKAELELELGQLELVPQTVVFDAKESLRATADTLRLTAATAEDIMIQSVEGLLSPAQERELTTWVAANGQEKTWAYYKATRLKPDLTEVYVEKDKLRVKTGMVISMKWVGRVAAVAAVALLLIQIWPEAHQEDQSQPVARVIPLTPDSVETSQPVQNDVNVVSEPQMASADKAQPRQQKVNTVRQQEQPGGTVIDELPIQEPAYATVDTARHQQPGVPQLNDKLLLADDSETLVAEGGQASETKTATAKTGNGVQVEEPYKLVTDVATNVIKRDVQFTREKGTNDNDLVGYSFKLGNFEFERKISR